MNVVSPTAISGKVAGQFFTSENVARSLVSWVVRTASDVLLDPSCGDGAFLAHHGRSRGIERDPYTAWVARERFPTIAIDSTDFFDWALQTRERFECVAGNPPFIRYQNFKGLTKAAASLICKENGVKLSGLSSAWTAFIVASASLLKRGGRMAFVVPAEIGHAPYATPLIDYLLSEFSTVQVIAVKEKLFPRLSEDCWLLYCDGRGGRTSNIHFTKTERFEFLNSPPSPTSFFDWGELKASWHGRLRTLLISDRARKAYANAKVCQRSSRFGDFAKIGIGYITGDNRFFHLSRSSAKREGIPSEYLVPTIRRGKSLVGDVINAAIVDQWIADDEECLLLALPAASELPTSVLTYLESQAGHQARKAYKCRKRPVWYSVPGIVRPDYLLQYMAGATVRLSRNDAGAACTNSILCVQLFDHCLARQALPTWNTNFVRLSCELEGHPLGGGMLKLEPGEASRILFPHDAEAHEPKLIRDALSELRSWRHV
ncbi:SAM-dependent DNA methyltransferase [Rhizobium sp. S152]|uniref:Eco57I restriction-modification methylase domain-containing protein n=1 Tax=Rhizobium sp. S152 TaxID=3055038 RepID=UPI0025A931D9|nr:SAM-dependent DNA methyltransferase [Rhizobium sp. S152]MDM9627381.1 SAM-dependent DNA methyltransferase [Rhizobium sp. S152]